MADSNVFGPYFTEAELGINEKTPDWCRANLFLVVKLLLNPIRAKFGPMKVDSGWRSVDHNLQVGGVEDSQHTTGEAVDFVCTSAVQQEVFNWIKTWHTGQAFYYHVKGHIHIALPNIKLAAAGRLYCLDFDDK